MRCKVAALVLCCATLEVPNRLRACPVTDATAAHNHGCLPNCGPTLLSIASPLSRSAVSPLPGTAIRSTPEATPLRVRRDQADIGAAGRQLYVDAMKALKALPPKGAGAPGPANRYDEFVAMHKDHCSHFDSGFLPWHRKLLWEFETEIRQIVDVGNPDKYKNFTVPYWDWAANDFPHHLNPAAADNNFMGPDGNPANNQMVTVGPFRAGQWATFEAFPPGPGATRDLYRQFNGIGNLKTGGPAAVANMLAQTNFDDMSQISENGPELHNEAHSRVGGQLSAITSGADDPVFFMLHSYIDLLWERWELDKGSLSSYVQFGGGPALADNLNEFGNLASTIGFGGTPNNTVQDQLDPFDTSKLGFTYEFGGQILYLNAAWNVDAGGNWSTLTNWKNGMPNQADVTATFGDKITADRTVTVDAARTVGSMVFNNTRAYTIAGTNAISLDVSAGTAGIHVINGSHSISAPVNLNASAIVTVGPAVSTLTMSGVIDGAATSNFTKSGAGALVLSGTNTFPGAISITGGKIVFSEDAHLGAVGGAALSRKIRLSNNSELEARNAAQLTLGANKQIIVGSGGGKINTALASLVLQEPDQLRGTERLTKTGSRGLLLVTDNPNFSGPATVATGSLELRSADALGQAGAKSEITLLGGTQLNLVNDQNTNFDNNVVHDGSGLSRIFLFPATVGTQNKQFRIGTWFYKTGARGEYDSVPGSRYSLRSSNNTVIFEGDNTVDFLNVTDPLLPNLMDSVLFLGAATINTASGNFSQAGSLDGPGNLNKGGSGMLELIDSSPNYSATVTAQEGMLQISHPLALAVASLSIGSAGTVALRPGLPQAAKFAGLSVQTPGKLDVTNNGLVLDYNGTSPLLTIRMLVQSGSNGGAWNGSGITSSFADSFQRGVGYAEATALGLSSFMGQSFNGDAVLMRLVRYGDADLNGVVNLNDFNRLAANFGSSGAFWSQGDFTYDGIVNLFDFNRLAANFGLSAGPDGVVDAADWAALASVVPEPGGMLAVAMLGILLRRARREAKARRAEDLTPW